jgi:hypothetical protein
VEQMEKILHDEEFAKADCIQVSLISEEVEPWANWDLGL